MKILIKTTRDDYAIMVDSPSAAHAATLLAGAVLMKSDGYGADQRWSKADGVCSIEFIDDDRVQEFTPRERALEKQLSDKSTDWWKKYNEAENSKKRVQELEEQIALLQSVTVCTKEEPIAEVMEGEGDVPADAF